MMFRGATLYKHCCACLHSAQSGEPNHHNNMDSEFTILLLYDTLQPKGGGGGGGGHVPPRPTAGSARELCMPSTPWCT